MLKKIISIGVIACILTGCSGIQGNDSNFVANEDYVKYDKIFYDVFDTVTTVVGYTKTEEEFEKCTEEIYSELKEYHQLYDIYNDYEGINNIKTINDNAGIEPVKVDKKIIDMLLLAKEMYYKTDGYMNVAFGSVLELWHQYRTSGIENEANAQLPPMELLNNANNHTDIEKMIIDQENSTVYLEDKDMSIDVGAVGKGYATQMVANLESVKELKWIICVGSNVLVLNPKPSDVGWNVGIQNPDLYSDTPYVQTVEMLRGSAVTSGSYQRFYTVGGQKYHHIINKDTLMPSEEFAGITVICSDSAVGDVLSTALFNVSYEGGVKMLKNFEDNIKVVWIYNDGTIKTYGEYK